MEERQLHLLISNIMLGLSFLSSGWDRGGLILIGFAWLFSSVLVSKRLK